MLDEFLQELQRRRWDQVLTRLPEKRIDVALVKEFYSNLYDPEDRSPKFLQRPIVSRLPGQETSPPLIGGNSLLEPPLLRILQLMKTSWLTWLALIGAYGQTWAKAADFML